jgi:hypothetical protein
VGLIHAYPFFHAKYFGLEKGTDEKYFVHLIFNFFEKKSGLPTNVLLRISIDGMTSVQPTTMVSNLKKL